MGIPYLTKLVTGSRDVCQDAQFGTGRLVIDGSNLVYHLYFTTGLEQNHGGEYGAFENLVQRFIRALQICDISPYVVFDGCADFFSDQKWNTSKERTKNHIDRAHNAAVTGEAKGVLPTLIWEVFRQTLDSLKVPLVRSYTEADPQVAALANEWNCPVLSDDSDFFIFPVKSGMLPCAHFRWQEVQQKQHGEKKFIPCKKYLFSRFCEFYKIKPQLLPVFAVLAGNDYVRIPMPTEARSSQNGKHPSKLHALLHWISRLNEDDPVKVLKAALRDLPLQQREEKLQNLQEVVAQYSLSPTSPLSAFFLKDIIPPLSLKMEGVVPDWMRTSVSRAQFSSDFLDVVIFKRVGLSVVVDHKDKPSANLVSLPLRKVLYGLLLGPDGTVEERDRDGLKVKCSLVQADAQLPFCIKSLHQEEEERRRQVLLEALELDHQFHTRLPSHLPHLALPLAATCYWVMKATPPPELLKALLIGWCNGDNLRAEAAKDPDSKRSLNTEWCHWLNEWQSCLRDSFLLNQLLGCPLPQPTIAKLYSGTLLHVLIHKIRNETLDWPGIYNEDYGALLAIAESLVSFLQTSHHRE